MGTFRTLTEADLRSVLASYGLGGYRGHQPIAAGTINTNVAIDLADGRRFLRVNEGKAREDVEREAAIVAHLAAAGVPTPEPVRTTGGAPFLAWNGAFISLFPWLEGRTLRRDEVGAREAREAAGALARLHAAGGSYPDHRPGRYEPDEIERRLVAIEREAPADPALAEAVALLRPELARLTSARRPDLPLGLIHGDLFIDNVLFGSDGHLVALLDFEQASWGRLGYDLAVSVLAFGFGRDDFRPDVTRAFLDGYAAVRPPTPAERSGFADELCFAACRFAVTRVTDVYLRRAPGAPPGKDFRRYLQRLACVKRHAGDGLLAL